MARKRSFFSVFIRFLFTARMAMHGVFSNPLRATLTILGVVIGVASVVSLMGIGEGARMAVVSQFKSLGSNVIVIKAESTAVEFKPEYHEELIERVDTLKMATPVVNTKAAFKWRRTRGTVKIIGVNEDYPKIRDHMLASGRFFTGLHVKQRSQVAVVGYNLAIDLLKGRNLVGSTLTLNGQTYTIIGVMTEKGKGNADDIDNKILIPYSSAMKLANKRTVDEIWGKADSPTDADLAVVQLGRIFKGKLGLTSTARDFAGSTGNEGEGGMEGDGGEQVGEIPGEEPTPEVPETSEGTEELITVTNLNQLVEEVDNANRVMTLLLGGIAAVSLLVGGLGIMNIMMVAVKERTEEIGVRRALGAKQSNLLLQFLLEALYISVIGCVIGVIGGIWGLNMFNEIGFSTHISLQAIKIATIVALVSGLMFGVYPAISASSVPPVEALRGQ